VSTVHGGHERLPGPVTGEAVDLQGMLSFVASVNVKQRGIVINAVRTAFAQETEKEVHGLPIDEGQNSVRPYGF
jgi:hypothetical protein